jgi:hypothetical protein
MDYKFFRKEIKKWEKVELVLWVWEVIYKDNSRLFQYGEDGIFHQIREIDQSKLAVFSMRNVETNQRVCLFFKEGKKLFHEYENAIINIGTKKEEKLRAFIFGFEGNYIVITIDNHIIFTDNYNNVDCFGGKLPYK